MNVTDIPGWSVWSIEELDIAGSYRKDLEEINAPHALTAFVEKWKAVWMLAERGKGKSRGRLDAKVARNRFNKKMALQCIKTSYDKFNKDGVCQHALKGKMCIGMSIALPYTLLRASIVASQYRVPIGIALHQLYCNDPHHYKCF